MNRPLFRRSAALAMVFVSTIVLGPANAEVDPIAVAKADFVEVAKVLQSPRCRNCHPMGDAPLQTDAGVRHAMNVTRKSPKAGLPCSTCHRAKNADFVGGPPGLPTWHLPPDETPMVFEGRTPSELCAQLKDLTKNGNRSLADLEEHMGHDPLVLWAWSPGPGRTKPPLSHAAFLEHVHRWVAAGGPCP